MAATAWAVHDNVMDLLGNKVIEFDTDSFIVILGASASNMTTVATIDYYTNITGELSSSFGYTQGTKALVDPAWTEATGTGKWDEAGADAIWTASGGSIIARKAAIYDDTVTSPQNDAVICSSSLSSSDITATTGNTFTLAMNASGIFTVS